MKMPNRGAALGFLLSAASVSAPLTAQSGGKGFTLLETTIAETQAAVQSGQVTCRQLVEAYLKRIEVYDQTTHLNTVVLLNPTALRDADREDREFKRTHILPPLGGIVVVIKDNYDTKGLQTTGGSLAMKGVVPSEDAFMVKKMRDAGAIILFKSNMAEWAFSPVLTESSIGGVTRNPYDLSRVPAGSSGGTAAAIAANLVEVGLGTDTGDSIRGPASHNDLVGLRPTIGLTSRDGIIPLNVMADVGGPLARTVADAAAILSVVAGYDPADPITKQSDGHVAKDYTKFLDRDGLRGARIGVFRQYIETATTDLEIKALSEQAIAEMKAQGAVIVDPVVIPNFAELTNHIGCGDFAKDLNAYLATHAPTAPYKSLQEIYDSGLYLPSVGERMKRALDPKGNPNARPGPCEDVYHDEKKTAFRNAILATMDANKLDAIVYPTWSNPPRIIGDLKSPGGDNNQVLSPTAGCRRSPCRWASRTAPCRQGSVCWADPLRSLPSSGSGIAMNRRPIIAGRQLCLALCRDIRPGSPSAGCRNHTNHSFRLSGSLLAEVGIREDVPRLTPALFA